MTRTRGLSPKLHGPIAVPLGAVVYTLVETGHIDRHQLALLAVGTVAAVWAYVAGPGEVVTDEA